MGFRMRALFILLVFVVSIMARPMEHKLELLIEEEILLDAVHRELEAEIANEEKKIKRELRGKFKTQTFDEHYNSGEENMMNFITDYGKRFPYGQAGLSQYRPGR